MVNNTQTTDYTPRELAFRAATIRLQELRDKEIFDNIGVKDTHRTSFMSCYLVNQIIETFEEEISNHVSK